MNQYDILLYSISTSEELLKEVQRALTGCISMPNIPLKVVDNGEFWDTLATSNGWKMQQNRITRHARVLNDRGIRVAWGTLKSMEETINNLMHPWDICKPGDILAVDRLGGVYSHFAVYVGEGKVIHYAAEDGDFGEGVIHMADFSHFLRNQTTFKILSFPDEYGEPESRTVSLSHEMNLGNVPLLPVPVDLLKNTDDYHLYSPEETVQRAMLRLGENKYHLAFNNCEHFAIWCKTGIKESRQVERVLGMILAMQGIGNTPELT